jgi:hypothetical protein
MTPQGSFYGSGSSYSDIVITGYSLGFSLMAGDTISTQEIGFVMPTFQNRQTSFWSST